MINLDAICCQFLKLRRVVNSFHHLIIPPYKIPVCITDIMPQLHSLCNDSVIIAAMMVLDKPEAIHAIPAEVRPDRRKMSSFYVYSHHIELARIQSRVLLARQQPPQYRLHEMPNDANRKLPAG